MVEYDCDIAIPENPQREGYTFVGWDGDIPARVPDNDLTFCAQWRVNTHTVTFLNGYSGTVSTRSQDYGSDLIVPGMPVREGHTFAGWDPVPPLKLPDTDIVCTAQWTVNTYTISFNTGGGTQVPSITADYGTSLVRPSDPSFVGHTFTGWSFAFPDTMPGHDLVLNAVWRINSYTISFDTGGGTVIAPITGEYGSAVTHPPNPVRIGYTFTGWDRGIPSNIPASDVTVTAQWRINRHTITFDTSGGTEVPRILQDYGTAIQAPSDPVRTGHTFAGWYPAIPSVMPDADMNITARWTVNGYVVTFDPGNGSDPVVSSVDYASTIHVPDMPIMEGYAFMGWSPAVPERMPANPLTFTAVWSIRQYTISFNSAGGSETASVTADFGAPVPEIPEPVRTGYTFTGWNPSVPSTVPSSDLILRAQWSINQYTVSFANTGDHAMEPITADYGAPIGRIPDPVRTGHTFAGWDAAIPASMPARDATFTARWSVNQYTLSFDSAEGSRVDDITQDYGTSVTAPSDPVRTGYTFIGWSSPIPKTVPASDMSFTANWRINSYTVTFDTAGGTEILPQSGEYGSRITVPEQPVRTGHTFRGWSQTVPETFPACDLTITASWTVDRHTIRFDSAGGSSVASVTQDYGSPIPEVQRPVMDGYTFIGWNPALPQSMPAEDMTVTAQWRANRYTISFDTAGGTAIPDMTLDYGSAVRAPAIPELTGHRFVRWSSEIPMTMPSHDVALTAVWERLQYRITVDTGGGTAIRPMVQYYGTPVAVPDNPEREGYTFAGWSARFPETMPAENITVSAVWGINRYTISFDCAGGTEVPPITTDYGSAIPEPQIPRREGYRFVSWSAPVPQTMPSRDVRLSAVWEIRSFTMTFDTGEGSAVAPLVQDYSSPISVPEDPVRTGYTFLGWNPSVPETMPSSDTTVTAMWKINRYTVYFDSAGGSTVDGIVQNYGTRIVPPSDPVREGYTFRSWSAAIPETMPAGDVRLIAQWDVNSYRISFDSDGGSAIPAAVYRYGEPTVKPDDPVKVGYTFRGWSSPFPETMGSSDLSLKARWEINTYTVTFCDRGTETVLSLKYGSAIDVPVPENHGYALSWYPVPLSIVPDSDLVYDAVWTPNVHTVRFMEGDRQLSSYSADYGSVIRYPELTRAGHTLSWDRQAGTMPDEDLVITASWTVNSYQLTFVLGGGEYSRMTDYGARIIAPDPGEREGYYFSGWDRTIPGTMPDSDLTVEAVWRPTVKSGTGTDSGRFIASSGNSVVVSVSDLRKYGEATVGVDGQWSVSMDPKDFGSDGNVTVSMVPASKSVMGSVSDRAIAVYSLSVTDAGTKVARTGSEMTVSIPFSVPEGKEAVVWVMTGGDPVEVESDYEAETLTFHTDSATYWAAGYVDAEEEGFPLVYIGGIAGLGILAAAAAAAAVIRRIRG